MVRGTRASGLLLWVVLGVSVFGCSHTLEGPTPELTATGDPALVCNRQLSTEVTFAGEGLSPMAVDTLEGGVGLWLPQLTLTRSTDLSGMAAADESIVVPGSCPAGSAGDGCEEVGDELELVFWTSQQSMGLTIADGLGLGDGVYDLHVTNPNGNEADLPSAFVAVPPPTVERVEPMAICIDQMDVMIEIIGSGFLRRNLADGTTTATVRLEAGGTTMDYVPDSFGGCAALPAPATETETCTSMVVTIPEDDLPPDTYTLVVTNPETAACASQESITIDIVPPPVLDSITPTRICTGGGSIGLAGMGFRDGATVEAGDLAASGVAVSGPSDATATFGLGLAPGRYDVTITNPEGCFDTLVDVLEVVEGPILFWVDPPVVYNGISTQVTIFISGATAGVDEVAIVPAGGGTAVVLEHSFDMARGRIQAVVPAGTAPGDYDVRATASGCDTFLPGGLTVTDTLSLGVDAIDPAFGQTSTNTPVAIFGSGFAAVPRAYLNPDMPTASTVASEIRSVAFQDPSRLTGVVPSGLPVGTYDLIVVNQTGEVGLLEDAFTLVADAPPVVDEVLPGELTNQDPTTALVTGSGFASPTASWRCREPDGSESTLPGTVSADDGTRATVSIDATLLPDGTVCVLRMTNPDGSYGEFSAVAVTSPSSNLPDTSPATLMDEARRALALVSGRPTRQARFLYAIGGDDGADSGASTTSESAPVDLFGELGAWFPQVYELPTAATRTQAFTLGRFIYVVGGHDGAASTSAVYRAQVLDPTEAPAIVDLSARRGMGAGLDAGIWSYRVAAVFPASDDANPAGESLPSDPLTINLPDSIPDTIVLTIEWERVVGASEYRVYRTATGAGGPEVLQATVAVADCDASTCSWQDDGSTTAGTEVPLALGSHGTWVSMPSMNTPRSSHGLGRALDPSAAGRWYLYALGGRDGGGAFLDGYEYLQVDVAADGSHMVAAGWTVGAGDIGVPRAEHGVYSLDQVAAPASISAGDTYIVVAGGAVLGGGGSTSDVRASLVQAGGGLATTWTSLDGLSPSGSGFAHMAGNDFLFAFGGTSGSGAKAVRARAIAPDPNLDNWNDEGFSLTSARFLPGGATESAHVFVAGGANGGTALRTVESTIW